jgi:hypothetical protein
MCLSVYIYKDIKTEQLVRVRSHSYLGNSMNDRIDRKEDVSVLFKGKEISSRLSNLVFENCFPLDWWIKEIDSYIKYLKENSITVSEYLKSKGKGKVIIRTTFTFDTSSELGDLIEDYESNSEEEVIKKIKEEEKVFNDNPNSSFKYLLSAKDPFVKIEIIKK